MKWYPVKDIEACGWIWEAKFGQDNVYRRGTTYLIVSDYQNGQAKVIGMFDDKPEEDIEEMPIRID